MTEAIKVKGLAYPLRFTNAGYPEAAVNEELIADSIQQVLLTVPGERAMRPEFGSFLSFLLFNNMNELLGLRAAAEIRRAIRDFEPRVTVLGITFGLDRENSTVRVSVSWTTNGFEAATTVVPITVTA